MTRKHFEAVASVIKQNLDTAARAGDGHSVMTCKDIALGLAYQFAAFNSNFDRTRFLRACGLDV